MGPGSLGVSPPVSGGATLRIRIPLLLAMAVIVPLGFATKLVGPLWDNWFQYYAGGVLYVIFWILALVSIRPRLAPARAAGIVLAITCALEVMQLWHPPPLEAVRSTFLGRALIGTSFSWWDFPHYALGALLGGLLAAKLAPPIIARSRG